MRRGKLNKKSIILIFIVAIFTIFSYGFDQLVIRTEDKLRNLKINFQNIENKLSKHEALSDSLLNISQANYSNVLPTLLRRNLLIKTRLLTDAKIKGYDFFSGTNIKNNQDDLEWMLLKDLNKVARLNEEIRSQYYDFYLDYKVLIEKVNNKEIRNLDNLFSGDMKINNENNLFFNDNILVYEKLIGYNRHWKNKSNELADYRQKALKNFEARDWYDVYRYKMLLLKHIHEETLIVEEIMEKIDFEIAKIEDELTLVFEEIKTQSIRKNYFILTSILSQILSLLFLLLLFRTFLVKPN